MDWLTIVLLSITVLSVIIACIYGVNNTTLEVQLEDTTKQLREEFQHTQSELRRHGETLKREAALQAKVDRLEHDLDIEIKRNSPDYITREEAKAMYGGW